MTVTITYENKPVGTPMHDLSKESLLQFIESQMELGRTVHITPDKEEGTK